jgi:hypothetical protein
MAAPCSVELLSSREHERLDRVSGWLLVRLAEVVVDASSIARARRFVAHAT